MARAEVRLAVLANSAFVTRPRRGPCGARRQHQPCDESGMEQPLARTIRRERRFGGCCALLADDTEGSPSPACPLPPSSQRSDRGHSGLRRSCTGYATGVGLESCRRRPQIAPPCRRSKWRGLAPETARAARVRTGRPRYGALVVRQACATCHASARCSRASPSGSRWPSGSRSSGGLALSVTYQLAGRLGHRPELIPAQ